MSSTTAAFVFEKTSQVKKFAIHSMIEWHSDNVPEESTLLTIDNFIPGFSKCNTSTYGYKFGILRVAAPKVPISITPMAILLNIDNSSSMDDIDDGHYKKIDYIKHTLKNVIHVLMNTIHENPELVIYICIDLFTHNVTNLFTKSNIHNQGMLPLESPRPNKFELCTFKDDFILLDAHSVNLLLTEIGNIRPWGYTNIEMALKHANTKMTDFAQKTPSSEYHIYN